MNLSARHKNELQRRFGADEFRRFDKFVKKTIAPGIQVSQTDGVVSFSGHSGISIDQTNQVLRGTSSTIIYTRPNEGSQCPASVSATMTRPNVSVSGSNNECSPNPYVVLESTTYQSNSQYCIDGTHTYNFSIISRACLMPEPEAVIKVWYEQIANDDLPIDTNPNTPNCAETDSSAGCGQRIFPDDKVPDDSVDRRKILVRAKYNGTALGKRIYFRSFDADDPSANAAPIDTNGSAGDDNNGLVNGTANTKNGLFSIPNPNPNSCQLFTGGISCVVDSNNIATAEFTTTMQPGDNFTVVAGLSDTYVGGLMPATDGINLKDTNNVQIPVSTPTSNSCLGTSVQACRANMLTVWRRLHIEIDSMGNVGVVNRVTGTVNGNVTIPGTGSGFTPGVGTVNINTPSNLDSQRFDDGRLVVGSISLFVQTNTANSLTVFNTGTRSVTLNNMSNFILYDDDYNGDDSIIQSGAITYYSVDGDNSEPLVQLPKSLEYLSTDDGNYSDGKPKNVYGSAYVRPEYNWAQNYNQDNLSFNLNVENGNNGLNVVGTINANRGSTSSERDDFWVGYVLLGYQGPELEDFDGANGNNAEKALQGISGSIPSTGQIPVCDCYNSSICPTGGVACVHPTTGAAILPTGRWGSLIYQEVNQDLTRYFKHAPQAYRRDIEEIKITIPHEIGHQFGVLGDQKRQTFKLMDYSDYIGNIVNDVGLHPEHINIIRRRIKSPGE